MKGADNGCPHYLYNFKHFCNSKEGCTDYKQVTPKRNAYNKGQYKTNVNTVLVGDLSYSDFKIQGGKCVNTKPLKAYECNAKTGKCKSMGDGCTTYHDMKSGHLFYKEMKCTK